MRQSKLGKYRQREHHLQYTLPREEVQIQELTEESCGVSKWDQRFIAFDSRLTVRVLVDGKPLEGALRQ